MIGALQLFDLIWVTTGGGPVNASNTMATYMFDWGFERHQLGYGSAVAVILFVLARRGPRLPTLGPATRHRRRPHQRRRVRRSARARQPPSSSSSIRAPASGRHGHHRARPVRGPWRFQGCRPDRGEPDRTARSVGLVELHRSLDIAVVLAPAAQPALVAAITTIVLVTSRRLLHSSSRARVPGSGARLHAIHARAAVSRGSRRPTALHPHARPWPARQSDRPRTAAGGVWIAADDHHPATVFRNIPE